MSSSHSSLDAATRALYERVRDASRNRELLRVIDSAAPPRAAAAAAIVLVPGIFYRDFPHTGADGAPLRAVAESLGVPFATIPVDGTEGVDAAADAINAWLAAAQFDAPIILFSLSKGSAEVRHALTKPEAERAFRRVAAWVSVSGLPFGTSSLEITLRNPLRRIGFELLCLYKRWRLATVRHLLRHRPAAPFVLPSGLRFVQIAAFPQRRHLRDRRSRRLHAGLASLGPNDGFAVLEELAALPGQLYPIWGVDHYLRGVDDLSLRLARLVGHLAQGHADAAACAPPDACRAAARSP